MYHVPVPPLPHCSSLISLQFSMKSTYFSSLQTWFKALWSQREPLSTNFDGLWIRPFMQHCSITALQQEVLIQRSDGSCPLSISGFVSDFNTHFNTQWTEPQTNAGFHPASPGASERLTPYLGKGCHNNQRRLGNFFFNGGVRGKNIYTPPRLLSWNDSHNCKLHSSKPCLRESQNNPLARHCLIGRGGQLLKGRAATEQCLPGLRGEESMAYLNQKACTLEAAESKWLQRWGRKRRGRGVEGANTEVQPFLHWLLFADDRAEMHTPTI